MDAEQRNTIQQLVAEKIDLIRFGVMNHKQLGGMNVKFAVESFADDLIAGQFERYTREEMLNGIRNGWIFEFKELLVKEIMADTEIELLDQMELKLV